MTLSAPRLGIAGLGLIGGAAAAAWRRAGAVGEMIGFDPDPAAGRLALERGLVDRVVDRIGALGDVDVVLVAAPVGACAGVLRELAPALGAQAIVSDVASAKGAIVAAARIHLGAAFDRFVPAHPIAGSERSGAAHADAGLFSGRRVVTTPVAETDPSALARIEDLWRAAGARIERMTPERHDHVFAAVSHLPHLAAFALVATIARAPDADDLLRLAGGGFRDSTRIAASSAALWRDIALANAGPLGIELGRLRESLDEMQRALGAGDGAALESLFALASRSRRAWVDPAATAGVDDGR